jgi:hypothetical protein
MSDKTLLFVYNADSGFFNTVADIAHKITSPDTYECELCALTHDTFNINRQWKQFLAETDLEFVFLHRDEFRKKYPEQGEPLPAIFVAKANGLEVLIGKQQLQSLTDVQQLIELIRMHGDAA